MPGTTPFDSGFDPASRRPIGSTLDPVFVFGALPSQGPVRSADRQSDRLGDGLTPSRGAADNWLLGRNVPIRKLARTIERAAEVECTVLLRGEHGTGKELWARLLHQGGPRGYTPFIAVDCAGLTPGRAEIQLFGQVAPTSPVAGAAAEGTPGFLREASGGVLFLDDVGALPAGVQPLLLRAIERREVVPVGGDQPLPVDVQVVAATSRNLEQDVALGAFDRGLYERLNMLELRVPPLRERIEDIPAFVEFFSRRIAARLGLPSWQPSPEALAAFCEHPWPGNVRQMEEVIERVYRIAAEPRVTAADAAAPDLLEPTTPRGDAVREALAATRGRSPSNGECHDVRAARINTLLGRMPGR
jgi:DNA-binding NtrC family response regulator